MNNGSNNLRSALCSFPENEVLAQEGAVTVGLSGVKVPMISLRASFQ